MTYEHMLKKNKKIEQKIKQIQTKLKKLPEGQLYCSSSGKYTKWFCSNGKDQIYIPKKKRRLAEQLALKKYLTLQLKNLQHEKIAINFYLRHHDKDAEQKEVSLLNSPAYKELLSPFYQPISQELFEWTNSPYEKNDNYSESLKHKAVSGGYVRSKSEQIIDMVLYKNKIPFRYECALRFGETVFYPDFTIRHPKTGQLFYWEHFGLMDDADYSKKAYSKLQTYTSHGLIPTIQLITTYETKDVYSDRVNPSARTNCTTFTKKQNRFHGRCASPISFILQIFLFQSVN